MATSKMRTSHCRGLGRLWFFHQLNIQGSFNVYALFEVCDIIDSPSAGILLAGSDHIRYYVEPFSVEGLVQAAVDTVGGSDYVADISAKKKSIKTELQKCLYAV
jgi:hypothetical protein